MNARLEVYILGDSSGCSFTLVVDGERVKTWFVKYGYSTPEWEAHELKDRTIARDELIAWGFPELAAKVLA